MSGRIGRLVSLSYSGDRTESRSIPAVHLGQLVADAIPSLSVVSSDGQDMVMSLGKCARDVTGPCDEDQSAGYKDVGGDRAGGARIVRLPNHPCGGWHTADRRRPIDGTHRRREG